MRTLLALVVAAALIGGALYIRGGGLEGSELGPIGSSEPAVLVCVTELKPVCDALARGDDEVEVRIEDAGKTFDTLTADAPVADASATETPAPQAPEADAWLTLAPWPQMVSGARERGSAAALPSAGQPLGRSPLVLVVSKGRAGVLEQDCPDLSWGCLGRSAGVPWTELGGQETWGQFKPGLPDPVANATGLLVLGQAASEFLGDSDFSARDLDSDRFRGWLVQFGEGVAGHGSPRTTPLQEQLQFGVGQFDLVGTTEAEAGPRLTRSARSGDLDLRYPKKIVVAEVVLAPLREGDGADRLRSLVEGSGKTALAEAGWRVEEQPFAEGVSATPALPDETNVPPAGALDALRARWQEVAR